MPEECIVSCSSATTLSSWWDLHQANPVSSWYNKNPNYNQNSSLEDDASVSTTSLTNASNHSGLTTDHSASSDELLREHASTPNHLWSHVLLHGGSSVDLLDGTRNFGDHVVDPLGSKSSSTSTFDNYLKKMDSNETNWGYTNQFKYGFNDPSLVQSQRLNKLSNFVGDWSIAPPNPDITHQFDPQTCDISLCSSTQHQYKHVMEDINGYDNDLKVKIEDFCQNLQAANIGSYHGGLNASMIQGDSQYINEVPRSQYGSSRSFLDIRLTRPLTDINPAFKPSSKSLSLSEFKKKELQISKPATKSLGITNEGKKKRSEEMTRSEVVKKPKNGASAASPVKEPKPKLRDKITNLQQIVSPFGKTDTASVLQEAIACIKFLEEQVKLLSNPYMKNSQKDPWSSWDREDKNRDTKYSDLRSRGLCLVPTSCTPQVYRETTGSDYWGPTYRGCLYR